MMKRRTMIAVLTICGLVLTAQTANAAPDTEPAVPTPTLTDVPYGKHERHILDFWKADSVTPTPLVFVIHGGGWRGGDKDRVNRFVDVQTLLNAGISVTANNYRFIKHAEADGTKPPVKMPLHDAARALQFVRSKASEWNIDKTRIGAAGGSAGACSSLWLAFPVKAMRIPRRYFQRISLPSMVSITMLPMASSTRIIWLLMTRWTASSFGAVSA